MKVARDDSNTERELDDVKKGQQIFTPVDIFQMNNYHEVTE